jgi:hypothetical protein
MDYRHTGDIEDIERARLAQAGVTSAANDYVPPSYNSTTPLLSTSIPNGGGEDPAQQQTTSSSEEEPPFLGVWPALILFFFMMLPLFIIIGSWPALIVTGVDPLGFSFLAFLLLFSLVPSAIGILILVRVSAPYVV